MTRQEKITAGCPLASTGTAVPPVAAVPALITADARTVSPRQFLDALGLTSPEMRAARRERDRQACIRAIERGDTYGFPPVFVAECRKLMAIARDLGSEVVL